MKDIQAICASQAFQTLPGTEYNRVLQELSDGMTVFYEVAVAESETWDVLQAKLMSRFPDYLRYKRVAPHMVIVAVFIQETCYLLRGDVFAQLLAEPHTSEVPSLALPQ